MMDAQDRNKFMSSLATAAGFVGFLWLVHLAFWAFAWNKFPLMVIPGKLSGLTGILTSPLLHEDYVHLFLNSGPLFMFFVGMFYFYRRVAVGTTVGIWLITGVLVWILAPSIPTLGASGIVYGFGSFLFFSGIFRRDFRSMMIMLSIAVGYGGMINGIFPGEIGVSWESHLFGAVAGIVMSFYFRKVDVPERRRYSWEDEAEQDSHDENAAWNYRENWSGANQLYTPPEPESKDSPMNE